MKAQEELPLLLLIPLPREMLCFGRSLADRTHDRVAVAKIKGIETGIEIEIGIVATVIGSGVAITRTATGLSVLPTHRLHIIRLLHLIPLLTVVSSQVAIHLHHRTFMVCLTMCCFRLPDQTNHLHWIQQGLQYLLFMVLCMTRMHWPIWQPSSLPTGTIGVRHVRQRHLQLTLIPPAGASRRRQQPSSRCSQGKQCHSLRFQQSFVRCKPLPQLQQPGRSHQHRPAQEIISARSGVLFTKEL